MDVYFYEAFDEEADSLRKILGASVRYEMTPDTIQEAGHAAPPAPFISIRTQSSIPVSWAPQLTGILSRSTGYDHLVAYRAASGTKLPCGYLEEYATRAVAEHAILTLTALFRRLPRQQEQFPRFNRDGITGMEFGGKNLLIVGVGRIGGELAHIASGMGMNVRGVDLVRRHEDVEYVPPEEGVHWADAIVCAMNLTAQNRGYFRYDVLRHGRPGLLFVNVARGEHAPTADLIRLVTEGRLGGVALDVFEQEPDVAGTLRSGGRSDSEAARLVRELARFPNVLLTPHNAFNTIEAVNRKAEFSVKQVKYFLQHKDFIWKVG